MSLHFPIQSRVGVSHNLRTGNANGQQMETSEIQSSGQFFLSYLTNANLRAIFLLEDQRFLLKPIFVVRNQLLSQLLNCNRPFIVSECPYPGAIHAGYLSKLGGGHFSKREDRNSNLVLLSCSFGSKGTFVISIWTKLSFSLGELSMHVSPFYLSDLKIPFIPLLSRNGFSSCGSCCNATVGPGLDPQTPWCQHFATAQNSKIGGQWCKSCICSAHKTSFWWELGDQTCSLWSLRHVEQGFLWSLRYFSASPYWALFHLRQRSPRLLEMCQQQPLLGGCSCWKGIHPCRRTTPIFVKWPGPLWYFWCYWEHLWVGKRLEWSSGLAGSLTCTIIRSN